MPVTTSRRGSASEKKRIIIVDDHPVLRLGLSALIESDSALTVSGEAATYGGALEVVEATRPDLIIVDIEIEGRDGLSLVQEIKRRYPKIPALVLSMHDEAIYGERALRAGALGYLSKKQLDNTVLVAIHSLLNGKTYISEVLKGQLAAKFVGGKIPQTNSPVDVLSNRELQVFNLIGRGCTTRQIADKLSLSIKTIESHTEHIKQKLKLDSAAELAHQAVRWIESIQ